jgi:D-3-phosphoglycerate dehydrogenase
MPQTVVVTDHDFEDLSIERAALGDAVEVIGLSDEPGAPVDPATLAEYAPDAVVNLRTTLSAEHVAALDGCRVIARYGIGVDNVDVDAATERGIPVTNVPDYCREEVATHAIALLLGLLRGVGRYDDSVGDGEWDRAVGAPLHRLSTRTVGVVGYGAIGRAVGARIDALGADVIASDPFLEPADVADDPAELVPFEDLLARADAVTVHSPLTADTRELFDAEAFARMRDAAVLVNVARGPIVDDDALATAIEEGTVAGAGLDVFPEEPPAPDHPLRDHPRVLATPHVAWYSEEANDDRRRTVAGIVADALAGREVGNVVNED